MPYLFFSCTAPFKSLDRVSVHSGRQEDIPMKKLLIAVGIAGLAISLASAAPPGGGGTGGGTIFYLSGGSLNTMNSDGSSKTALPAGVFGNPSRILHGGHRW